jgi:hypothetical protein
MLRNKLLAIGLGAAVMLGSAVPSMAAPRRNGCARRIHQAEMNLNRAIQRHGARSRQAAERRRQLERARANCGAFR